MTQEKPKTSWSQNLALVIGVFVSVVGAEYTSLGVKIWGALYSLGLPFSWARALGTGLIVGAGVGIAQIVHLGIQKIRSTGVSS